MHFFYESQMNKIKRVSLTIILAFVASWALFIGNIVYTPVFSTKEGPAAIYQGDKGIALTFNIGWGDEKAAPILKVLKEEGVPTATFFLSGSWAERHPDLVEQIVKEGYEIGMLGYEYKDYSSIEEDEIKRDLMKAQTAFAKLQLKDIEMMRAPTGHFNKKTLLVVDQLGLTTIHWSIDSEDWTNPGVETIVDNVTAAKNGDIILMHASDSAKQTAAALPQIIQYFHKKNLKFVTIEEMVAHAQIRSSEIK